MIEHGLFSRHFVGRDGFLWWIGQIPPEESWRENIPARPAQTNSESKGFGERYRVRIMGHHTANAEDIPDEELPWAYVMYPVTAGGGGRGSSQSANLTQGTFVFGFFIDGDNGQLPIIMGVLGHNDYNEVMKNVTPTRFVPLDGYPRQDEVFGSERSALQVKPQGTGGETLPQNGGQGEPANDQYTSSAQSNTSQKPLTDDEEKKKGTTKEALAQTSECEKAPMGDIQNKLKNVMNQVQNLQQMMFDANASLVVGTEKIQAKIQALIADATKFIAAQMKWIFSEIERHVLKLFNDVSKKTFSLVLPNQRELLRVGITKGTDAIACIFRSLINELNGMVGGFMGDLFGQGLSGIIPINGSGGEGGGSPSRAVNAPRCFVEDFVANTIGQISGNIMNSVNEALSAVSSVTGVISSLAGGISGFIEDLFAFISCGNANDVECPPFNEWSIWDGVGSKGGDSSLSSLVTSAQSIASQVEGIADGSATDGIISPPSLSDINFSGVFDNNICYLGPRPCGSPTVEYIGDGEGAKINLVVSDAGEVLAADVISSGYGFSKSRSTLRVYDDCGNGTGAVIRPIYGEVAYTPVQEGDSVVKPKPNTGRPGDDVFNEPKSGKEKGSAGSDNGGNGGVGGPGTGNGTYIEERGGADITKELTTQELPTGDNFLDVCRRVDFTIESQSILSETPARVTFTLIGDPPDFPGTREFSFDILDQERTFSVCVYPNREYLVTSRIFAYPNMVKRSLGFDRMNYLDSTIFDPINIEGNINAELGYIDPSEYDVSDPDLTQIFLISKRDPYSVGGILPNRREWLDAVRSGDYSVELELNPDIIDKRGPSPYIWVDIDDTVGSAGPRDLQVYPDAGMFYETKNTKGRSKPYQPRNNIVIYRLNVSAPEVIIPPDVPENPIGIVTVIVEQPGTGYLPLPDGSVGGDETTWAPIDNTVVIDPSEPIWYPPIPPGNVVKVPPGSVITTPITAPPTEVDPGENRPPIPVLPGVPTPLPDGGVVTTPDPNDRNPNGPGIVPGLPGGGPGAGEPGPGVGEPGDPSLPSDPGTPPGVGPNTPVVPPGGSPTAPSVPGLPGGPGLPNRPVPPAGRGPADDPFRMVPPFIEADTDCRSQPINTIPGRSPIPSYIPQTPYPTTNATYPVILYLCDIIIDNVGVDYLPGDQVVIDPPMGAKATVEFDGLGRITTIKVTEGGEGFKTFPDVYIRSETGFGSKLLPKFCIDRIGEDDLTREPGLADKLIDVVDCVGKFTDV